MSLPDITSRDLVEDALVDTLRFGFRVRWEVRGEVSAVFEAFEMQKLRLPEGDELDDGGLVPEFECKGAESSDDTTPNIDEAEPYLDGFIKWDGCAEITLGHHHWCGGRDFEMHCRLLAYLAARAFELMGRPAHGETWTGPVFEALRKFP